MSKKPHVLCLISGVIPSVELGMFIPVRHLHRSNLVSAKFLHLRFCSDKTLIDEVHNADLVFLCRSTSPFEEKILRICSRLGKPFLYEVDDNFFEISTDNPVGHFHRNSLNLGIHKLFVKKASCVRVYNETMKQQLTEYNKNISIGVSYFDFSKLKSVKAESPGPLRIGYITGRIDSQYIKGLVEGLVTRLLEKYGDKIEFHFWSKILSPTEFERPNVILHDKSRTYDEFLKYVQTLNLSIGLAPIEDTKFNNSKTNNKYREYGALNIAGVYSNCPPYSDSIIDGAGVLVENDSEAWFNACCQLIENKEKITDIQVRAHEHVRQAYTLEKHAWQLYADIMSCFNSTAPKNLLSKEFGSRKVYVNICRHEDRPTIPALVFNHLSKTASLTIPNLTSDFSSMFANYNVLFLHEHSPFFKDLSFQLLTANLIVIEEMGKRVLSLVEEACVLNPSVKILMSVQSESLEQKIGKSRIQYVEDIVLGAYEATMLDLYSHNFMRHTERKTNILYFFTEKYKTFRRIFSDFLAVRRQNKYLKENRFD